jgi:ring-1,2-phenylacetyl-CoA epoxidase subunit PaaD
MRPSTQDVWAWLGHVSDPEIPVISIVDLGIVRNIEWSDDNELIVTVTPTYSGCPATRVIEQSITAALREHGIEQVTLRQQLSPAWTTDWVSNDGRKKLRAFGVAPPAPSAKEHVVDASRILHATKPDVCCPRCGAGGAKLISQFGSTPCKALYQCGTCREPFDYFKPH